MPIDLSTHPPTALLKSFKVLIPQDPPFRSWFRLKQSVFREKMGWECGRGGSDRRPIGNYLAARYADQGENFLNRDILTGVHTRLGLREPREVILKDRLFRNMLTSQTLCFNLFIPQMRDNALATKIWKALLPSQVRVVTAVKIEHSPGRGDPAYGLGDHSAFDAYVEYTNLDGSHGKIAIETKYTDSFSPPGSQLNERQQEILRRSRLYHDRGRKELGAMPTQQLYRTHLLAESLRTKECPHILYAVFHAEGDQECAQLLPEYVSALNPEIDINEVFLPCTLERICQLIEPELADSNSDWLNSFRERYLDWSSRVRKKSIYGDSYETKSSVVRLSDC